MLHDALNAGAQVRHSPAAQPLGAHGAAGRRALRLAHRIQPRLTHLAGLEMGAGVHLNIVAPELAAAELRDA